MSDDQVIEPFANNQIAAAVPSPAGADLLAALRAHAGEDSVEIYPPSGQDEPLAPMGFFDKIRSAMSENHQVLDKLQVAADSGETILVVGGIDNDDLAHEVSTALIDADAGWIFRFDELSWTEIHTPTSRSAASTD